MPDDKYDIFISYSRHDLERVKVIKQDLELATGASCWMDLDGIESGEQFEKVIISAINRSDTMLFMLSKSSMNSEWALDELDFAKKKKKRIVIVHLEEVEQTDQFYFRYHKYDQIKWNDKSQREKLFRDICRWIDKEQESGLGSSKDVTLNERNEDSGFKYFLKNKKGCSITISIVLLLVIAYLPLKNLMLSRNSDSSVHSTIDLESASPTMDDAKCMSVDLGLPSGTLWGDRNLGSKSPSDFGNLYAWGEIKTKGDYSRYTYVEQLKPGDKLAGYKQDAATAELGDEWVMPTEFQFKELISECRWIWKKVDGHNGYEIIGKNGNKIFLPASGWSSDTAFQYRNQYGYYWTSDRSSNFRYARSLQFPKNGKGIVGNGELHVGRSIRAVYGFEAVAE